MTIQGLTLEATRADGVVIEGGTSNHIVGCTIRNVGNWAVRIEGGRDHAISDCNVFDSATGEFR